MLQSEMPTVIAEGEKKVIFAIMRRAKQCMRFFHQLLVFVDQFRWSIQSFISIGSNIEVVRRRRARTQVDPAEMLTGEHGRIDESRQRDGFELDIASICLCYR